MEFWAGYGAIGLFLLVAVLFGLITVFIPRILRLLRLVPYRPNPVKSATYECGMETCGPTWVQFNFRYYFFALLFVAFDVLVVFLFPWAVAFIPQGLGIAGFVAVFSFVAVLFVGLIYAWKKGALEWR